MGHFSVNRILQQCFFNALMSATAFLVACGGGGGAGAPAAGTPAVGAPAAGAPASGAPASGAPAAGAPATGALPQVTSTASSGAPANSTTGTETPRSADAFVDSAGVNVHLSNFGTLYGNINAVTSLLEGLGVRHIRDGTAIGQPSVCADDVQLAAAGIHIDLITATNLSMPALQAWATCLGPAIDTIEGPNEYDLSGDPNWVANLSAYAGLLYPSMKPATILAPAVTSEQNFIALGSLATSVDEGNMHDYFAARNPGTPGWGGTDAYGTYGSIAYNIALAAVESGGKPVVATETGYSDATDQYAVPAATKLRYTLRTLLEHWNAGVTRTYFYELADEGAAPPFSHYGLTDATGTPKPAYVGLKNLLSHLADPGGSFPATPLAYTLGAASSVHHTLLQKRNGHYVLILWVEQPEWDPNTSTALTVATQTATLTFAKIPSAVAATTFDNGGNVATTSVAASGGKVTLQITASPTIVDITP
jgi:hypothetical protein